MALQGVGARGSEGDLAASLECGVCCGLVVDNRACPQCRKLFCGACIARWLETRATDDLRACPMCRCATQLGDYVHDDVRQALADSQEIECEMRCGTGMRWGDREAHIAGCELFPLPCPYRGCQALVPRRDYDLHVYECNFRLQYAEADDPTGVCHGAHAPSKRNPADEEEEDPKKALRKSKVVVHFVREMDTLAGLAIKYGCAPTDIRRMNRLPTDNIHAHARLLIPADPAAAAAASEPTEADEGVLEALRRRRCIREFMRISRVREACEAVAYLNISDYDLSAAIAKHADDEAWATAAAADPLAKHKGKKAARRPSCSEPPKSLADFIGGLRERARPMSCHGCLQPHSPADARVHCSCCGVIFCARCGPVLCDGRVSKKSLGVTAPGAEHAFVRACNLCVASYGGRGAAVCVPVNGRRVMSEA